MAVPGHSSGGSYWAPGMFEEAISKIERPAGPLELRKLSIADSEELYALVQRNSGHLTQYGDYEDLISRTTTDWREALTSPSRNELVLGMTVGGDLIGTSSLIYYKPRIFGLGYWIDAQRQGQGYVTNACRVLVDYARKHHDAAEIWAGIRSKNLASIAVAKRLGLRLKRTQETHLSFLLRVET